MVKSDHELRKGDRLASGGAAAPFEQEFDAFVVAAQQPLAAAPATGPDDPGFWLYSSGLHRPPQGCRAFARQPPTGRPSSTAVPCSACARATCAFGGKLFFAYGLATA